METQTIKFHPKGEGEPPLAITHHDNNVVDCYSGGLQCHAPVHFGMLGFEPRALPILDRNSTTERHLQPGTHTLMRMGQWDISHAEAR